MKERAREVLVLGENDARALCLAWYLSDHREKDLTLLRRASEMGNAFACCMLSREVFGKNKEEVFRLAQLAAARFERDGFYWLGRCFREGLGCEKDFNLAKENYLIAAELGHVVAATAYGRLLGGSDPGCWLWLGRVALLGLPISFLRSFSKEVKALLSGSGNASVVFSIGRSLKGNIDIERKHRHGEETNLWTRLEF